MHTECQACTCIAALSLVFTLPAHAKLLILVRRCLDASNGGNGNSECGSREVSEVLYL